MREEIGSHYTMQSEQIFLRIRPCRMWYLKFILEGYDGVAVLSTIDNRTGLVLLRFPPDQRKALMTLLAHLAPHVRETAPEPLAFGDT